LQKDKNLTITLTNLPDVKLDQTQREAALTSFNAAGGNVIENQLATSYTAWNTTYEQEALLEVLKDDADPRWTKLMESDERKSALYSFLKSTYPVGSPL
jgi:hypothetical protein